MKAYYFQNKILLDFQRPILYNALVTFSINNTPGFIALPGPNSDTLEIAAGPYTELDDIYISYTADLANPFLYLNGPANSRLISSFETLVTIQSSDPVSGNVLNTTQTPLLADFINAYGLTEAILITNPEDSLASSPDEYRLLRALEDAEALYNSYVTVEAAANNLIITAGKRRTILTFARYFLDSRCRRKVVTDDYNKAILELENVLNAVVVPPGTDLYDGSEIAYGSQQLGCDSYFNYCGCH